ncbi:hypothetical protein, partial [Brevundimonas sp.]
MVTALLIVLSLQATDTSAMARAAAQAAAEDAARAAGEAAPAQASSGPPTFECVRDGSTPEINACLRDDLAAEVARMNQYLVTARERAR